MDYSTIKNVELFFDEFEDRLEECAVEFRERLWNYYMGLGSEDMSEVQTRLFTILSDQGLLAYIEANKAGIEAPGLRRRLFLLKCELEKTQFATKPDLVGLQNLIGSAYKSKDLTHNGTASSVLDLNQIMLGAAKAEQRVAAMEQMAEFTANHAPHFRNLAEGQNEVAREFGYSDYWNMLLVHSESLDSVASFDDFCRDKFTESAKAYDHWREDALARNRTSHLNHEDFNFFAEQFNRDRLDEVFGAERILTGGLGLAEEMGFLLDQLPLRTERAMAQLPTMTIALRIPSDVRMLVGSTSGLKAYELFAKEIGRAMHHLHIAQNHYMLKGLNSVIMETTAQLFQRIFTSEMGLSFFGLEDVLCAKLQNYYEGAAALQTRIFLTLCCFQRGVYENPQRDLNELWQDLHRKYLLMEGKVYGDWACQSTLINHPAHPLEFLVSGHYAQEIYSVLGAVAVPQYATHLTGDYFERGNAIKAHDLIATFVRSSVEN